MGARSWLVKQLGGELPVLNAPAPAPLEQQPVPLAWTAATMGPGEPVRPLPQEWDGNIPREWDYAVSVNSTIIPRGGYQLQPFPALLEAYELIPELKMAVHIMCRELGLFTPRIVNEDGDDEGEEGEYWWFTQKPDREMPWEIWYTRFIKSKLVYDAACLYQDVRNERLRYTDGSTIFPFIDEHGQTPQNGKAAYAQVIKGTPFQWFSTDELWYKPASRRLNAPYGEAPSELVWADLMVLANIKNFELSYYREGNTPEGLIFQKGGSMGTEQSNTWEQAFNSRMSAGAAERRRIRLVPFEGSFQVVKKGDFPEPLYKTLSANVYNAVGLALSELGQVPGKGLGGKGFAEMSESSLFRSGLNPNRLYVESACDDFLQKIGAKGHKFELAFPTEEENAGDLTTMVAAQVANALITINEGRSQLGLPPLKGGDVLVLIRGGQVQVVQDLSVLASEPSSDTSDSEAAADQSIDSQPTATSQDTSTAKRVLSSGSLSPTSSFSTSTTSKAALTPTPYDGHRATILLRKLTGVTRADDEYYLAPVAAVGTVDIPMDHHANEVCIVAMTPDELPPQPAVWKPFSGENPKLVARIGGPQYLREEAAYILDRAMWLYLVPVAYNARIDGSPGAVIFWSKDTTPSADVATYSPYWVQRAAVFDYVTAQGDRHTGNWKTHPVDPGRPILIDNGLCFPTTNLPIYSPFVVAMANEPLPKDLVAVCKVASHDSALWANLQALVGEDAVTLAKARLQRIIETGMLAIDDATEADSTSTTLSATPVGQG